MGSKRIATSAQFSYDENSVKTNCEMAIPLLQCEKKIKTRRLLEHLSDFEVRQSFGIPLHIVRKIIDLYEPISGEIATAIPLETKVLVFFDALRSGSFQRICGRATGISQPSSSRIIEACANETLKYAQEVINFPATIEALNRVKQRFHDVSGIPGVIGVVDGTHVAIQGPRQNEPAYVNRKLYHSINCQVVADRTYKIFDIVAKWPGGTHDSFIWRYSSVRERLNNREFGESIFLGKSSLNCV